MPQNITDVDAFTSPVEAPAGADVQSSANMLALLQKYANRTRYLFNRLVEPAPVARCTVLTPFVGFGGRAGGDAAWRIINFSTPTTEGQVLQSDQDFARWCCDLSAIFRNDVTITRIRAAVQPGAARATVGNRMTLWLAQGALDLATGVVSWTGPLETSTDDGSTDEQFIDTGTIAVVGWPTIAGAGASGPSGSTLHLHINAGNDAGTNRDQLRMIVINWTDPGLVRDA